MGRIMDRMKATIDALPDGGATIIVITNEVGRWLKRGIRERRGRGLARRCRTVAVARRGDGAKLSGLTGHIVLDGSFIERAKPHVCAEVDDMIAGVEATSPTA